MKRQTFLERRHADGQQTHGKVLGVASRQGHASQGRSEMSPRTGQSGCGQKVSKQQHVLARTGGGRGLRALSAALPTGAAPVGDGGGSSINEKWTYAMAQQFHFWAFIQRKGKTLIRQCMCTAELPVALFTMAKTCLQTSGLPLSRCPPVPAAAKLPWLVAPPGGRCGRADCFPGSTCSCPRGLAPFLPRVLFPSSFPSHLCRRVPD